MAFNLDFLKDIGGSGINIFGASQPSYLKEMQDMNLLSPGAMAKAKDQALYKGLLNTGLAYLAQPKNQGYGSAIPYLAKAGLSGMQASQGTYDELGKEAMMRQKLQEMQRAKNQQEAKDKFLSTWGDPNTGKQVLDMAQQVTIAPTRMKDSNLQIGSSLMGAPTNVDLETPVAPKYGLATDSIQNFLQNSLLGEDPVSFAEANKNTLDTKYQGIFDPIKAIDDAVKNGALEVDKALSMKASIAAANSKDEFSSASPDNIIYNKRTGEIVNEGNPSKKGQILSETQLKAFEVQQGRTYPRTDKNGLPYTYQINKDGKLEVLDFSPKGVNVQVDTGVQKGGSNATVEYLNKTRERAVSAFENLPRVKAAFNLISEAQVGALSQPLTQINKIRTRLSSNPEMAAQLSKVTSTEELQALLGADVFPLIGLLGIGARGLDTPAERDFLISVFTGSGNMERSTLKALTERRLRVSVDSISKYNKALDSNSYAKYKETYMAETGATNADDMYSRLDEGKAYEGLTTVLQTGQVATYRKQPDGSFKWQVPKTQ